MITPTNSTSSTGPLSPPTRARTDPSSPTASNDAFSTDQAAHLKAALARTPESRSEEVARAAALAVDLNYPPLAIINQVANMIAKSQDLSETPE